MEGGQMTAVMIVAIVMFAGIIRAWLIGPRKRRWNRDDDQQHLKTQAENQRLREEVGDLKERLKVLEGITVDKENSLSREIESLRDR